MEKPSAFPFTNHQWAQCRDLGIRAEGCTQPSGTLLDGIKIEILTCSELWEVCNVDQTLKKEDSIFSGNGLD